jgi:inward rectifier potassium channel
MARLSSPLPTQDPGLGEKLAGARRRLINRDGTFNVRRAGNRRSWVRGDWYHYWVSISWLRFILALVGWFTSLNVLFALGYLALGPDSILGMPPAPTWWERFAYAFFFSVQTFNSVGYGVESPFGLAAGLLSSVEALVGVLTFAIITGLLYARFSKPKARIMFSHHAIITPPDAVHRGHRRLMFRIANERSNTVIDCTARVLVAMATPGGDRRYFNLTLERSQVMFLPLNWTIVHEIDDESPLYELTAHDLEAGLAELLILLRGYDDTYAQDIHARSSYRFDEIRWNHRFVRPYRADPDGELLLDLDLLHASEAAG